MKKNVLAMVAVGLLAAPMASQAVLLRLDATTANPGLVTSWSVDFNDTGDGLFSLPELTSFSGMTCFGGSSLCAAGGTLYPTMVSVPNVPLISTGVPTSLWGFSRVFNGQTLNANASIGFWRYAISPITSSVPAPGTLALFSLGLLSLGLMRRRRLS